MKVYAAIGHFKDSKNLTSVVLEQHSRAAFMTDCYGNGFVPYVVMTETMMEKIFHAESDGMSVFEQVRKMTTNYRVWNIVTDYLTDAGYLITDKVEEIKAGRRNENPPSD